jgi:uncharacterized membrane protein
MTELNDIVHGTSVPGSSRLLAVLAYLLGPIGWVIAFLFGRNDGFVRFHIRQAIGLLGGLILGSVAWLLIGGAITVIPYFGPLLAAASFALVIALFTACAFLWIKGMMNAFAGRVRMLPLFGARANRLLGGPAPAPKSVAGSFALAAQANLAEVTRGQVN